MVAAIAKAGFPVNQHPQLSWDLIFTAWPTGLVTGNYSYDTQFKPQELPVLGIGNSVKLDLQVPELSSLWNQTSHSDSSKHFVPSLQLQNNYQAVEFEGRCRDIPAVPISNDRGQLHSTEIFSRGWPDQAPDTVCGWGSSEKHTRLVRKEFVELLNTYHVKVLNDAGCGDLSWMSMVDLDGVDYIGYDLYERANWADLRQRGYHLDVLDITANELRPADLLICRDVFIHLPNDMILATLERFRRSASLLLTTGYTSDPSLSEGEFSNFKRMDEPNLHHRKLDLTLPPFNLGQPLVRIPEDSPNKYLGLWDLNYPQTCL
ncbi:uncharacterized protein N7503_011258 [Penicillium pulvis]|uniref:uncharacterized protein n=1 Tax=Penicillium pulvis TaxID=1562058 RepID=UPI0025498711|nr:uncharacterized protein N7503_011258 [Penicillium pulvis]KAJ5786046.1 hypothetical protein N7503_011258 [Penicillium pulvis]